MNSDLAGEKLLIREVDLELTGEDSADEVFIRAFVSLFRSFADCIGLKIVPPNMAGYEITFDTETCGLNMKLVMRVYGK